MNALQALAFVNELKKEAAVPALLSRLWRSGLGRAGVGSAIGAGAGALASENPLQGAILGAGLGAGAGYGAALATKAGRQQAKEALKRFYKAQFHGITGMGKIPTPKKPKELASLRKAESLGLTSIPGVVKGLYKRPGETLRGAWQQSGTLGKTMTGLALALNAPGIVNANTPEGYGEKVLGTLGSTGGYLLGGRMPLVSSMLLASGTGAIGKRLGRGIDYLTGHKKTKVPEEIPQKVIPERMVGHSIRGQRW